MGVVMKFAIFAGRIAVTALLIAAPPGVASALADMPVVKAPKAIVAAAGIRLERLSISALDAGAAWMDQANTTDPLLPCGLTSGLMFCVGRRHQTALLPLSTT